MADPHTRTPNGFVVFAGSAAVLAIVIVVVACSLASGKKEDVVDRKRADQRVAAREALDKASLEQLTTLDWADRAKGVVRLPVADAMKLVAVELQAKKPAPSQVKIEPPLPMPPPYDPNSTEAPVPALTSSPQGADTIRFDPPAPPAAAPAPAAPAPAPAAPTPAAPPAAAAEPAKKILTASATPNRPPLIHWTEPSEK